MAIKRRAKCETCWFYSLDRKGQSMSLFGVCHVEPPRIGDDGKGEWPLVEKENWCGCYLCREATSGLAMVAPDKPSNRIVTVDRMPAVRVCALPLSPKQPPLGYDRRVCPPGAGCR